MCRLRWPLCCSSMRGSTSVEQRDAACSWLDGEKVRGQTKTSLYSLVAEFLVW